MGIGSNEDLRDAPTCGKEGLLQVCELDDALVIPRIEGGEVCALHMKGLIGIGLMLKVDQMEPEERITFDGVEFTFELDVVGFESWDRAGD